MGAKNVKLIGKADENFKAQPRSERDSNNKDGLRSKKEKYTSLFTAKDIDYQALLLMKKTNNMNLLQVLFDPTKCSQFIVLRAKEIEMLIKDGTIDQESVSELLTEKGIQNGLVVTAENKLERLKYIFDEEERYIEKNKAVKALPKMCHNTALFYVRLIRLFNVILMCLHNTQSDGIPISLDIDPKSIIRKKLVDRKVDIDDFMYLEDMKRQNIQSRMNDMKRKTNDDDTEEDTEEENTDDDNNEEYQTKNNMRNRRKSDKNDDDAEEESTEEDENENNENENKRYKYKNNEDTDEEEDTEDEDEDEYADKERLKYVQQSGGGFFKKGKDKKNNKGKSSSTRMSMTIGPSFDERRYINPLKRSQERRLFQSKSGYGFSRMRINQMLNVDGNNYLLNETNGAPTETAYDAFHIFRNEKGLFEIDHTRSEPIYIQPLYCFANLVQDTRTSMRGGRGCGEYRYGRGNGNGHCSGGSIYDHDDKNSENEENEEIWGGDYGKGRGKGKGKGRGKGKNKGKRNTDESVDRSMNRDSSDRKRGDGKSKGKSETQFDSYSSAKLENIKPFEYIEALYYDEWLQGFEQKRKMSENMRSKHEKDLKRLIEVFMGKDVEKYKLPTTFGDVKMREIRRSRYLDYFCNPSKNRNSSNDNNDAGRDKNILDQKIRVTSLQNNTYAKAYVETAVEYLNNMVQFEREMFLVLKKIFVRHEVLQEDQSIDVDYEINSDFTLKDLDHYTESVRSSSLKYIIECELMFQKAMKYYKRMVVQKHAAFMNERHGRIKYSDPEFAQRELSLWNQLKKSEGSAYD